jgi:hypothetical protein
VAKYVVSSTIDDPGWQNSTVLSGDPVEQVASLKAPPGGRRLFPDGFAIPKLQLVKPAKSFRSGITLLRYASL